MQKITDFPSTADINKMSVYSVKPADPYLGLFELKGAEPLSEFNNQEDVHRRYSEVLELFNCCAQVLKDKNTQLTPSHIVQFSGPVPHRNVVVWVYTEFYQISVNPQVKFLVSNQFTLSDTQAKRLKSVVGLD